MSASPPIPLPAAAGVISGLLTFVVSNSQGVSPGTGLPLAVIIGIVVYYFTFVVSQQPNIQTNTNENQKPKKKTKQDKKKATASSSSSAASDDEEVASKKKKDKKSKKAAPSAPIPVDEEENENESEASTSEADGDNDDDDGSSLSKNAKKKAKKKAKELAAKKEEEKKAAAASAKKATPNKKEEKKQQQSAPVSVPVPAPAPSGGKKDKKTANKENVSVSPAPVVLSPPQEEDFQQSKSDKKKNKKDEKKKREEEAKLTQPKVSETPKTPTPISPAVPAPVKESKKHESKSQLHAAPITSLSPPPTTAESEEGEWNVAKAARPTSAQKQANKAAESKSSLESSSVSSVSEPADYVDIPVSKVAAIIGTKGAILKALQEGTHATIEVPKAAERDLQSLTARILIRGDPEAVKYAKICVKSLAEKGYSPVTHPGFSSDDVYVESKLHGMIIGPKGSTLKNIQTKTGTIIRMPERGGNDRLIIVGPKEGVKAAKEAIKSLVADGFSSLTHEGQEKKEIEFPSAKFGILIGPSGQTIRSIQGNTKTQIKIPATGAANQNVVVIGPPAGVLQAEKEIRRLLEPKTPKKPEGKDENDDEPIPSSEESTSENPTSEAPQSAFDAWNAAEAQPSNEDALWAADQ